MNLKHGTIALIEEGTPVIAIISDEKISHNTRSNLNEVIARGARTIKIVMSNVKEASDEVVIDQVHPLLTPYGDGGTYPTLIILRCFRTQL